MLGRADRLDQLAALGAGQAVIQQRDDQFIPEQGDPLAVAWFRDRASTQPAILAARNYPLADKAIFHSGRGSNYTSGKFAVALRFHGLRQSDRRAGICYDNAMAESFFAALKNERISRTVYPTREHARREVVRYIEFWYNSKRRHSGLQYRTPQQILNEYLEQQTRSVN
jgi:transposase InsO family protein